MCTTHLCNYTLFQVGESLVIEYDNPDACGVTVPFSSKTTSGSPATIKREAEEKYTVSTDDLTCNVCGQEYAQWTQLKKHLMDHILIAQNSADGKAKVSKFYGVSYIHYFHLM